jgi:hypothetical protein
VYCKFHKKEIFCVNNNNKSAGNGNGTGEVSCLVLPNVVDIRGGHPQAAGGNNPHGKGLFSAK